MTAGSIGSVGSMSRVSSNGSRSLLPFSSAHAYGVLPSCSVPYAQLVHFNTYLSATPLHVCAAQRTLSLVARSAPASTRQITTFRQAYAAA